MANFATSWILNLVDNVTAPLQSVQGVSGTAATAVNSVGDANTKVAATGTAAATATTASGKAAGFATGMFRSLSTTLLPLIGIGAAISTVTSSLKLFDTQAKAEAQVLATLDATGGAAGKTFEELTAQASALQDITLFGDEETLKAQALMLSFKAVSGEIYDRSIPAVQDMATAMDMDLKSSALMVGKALNDPIQGLTALRRSGIQFTESQQDLIRSLTKSGDVAQAQTMILSELESQFGGSAEAAALAGTGAMTQIGNTWGDLKEVLGQGFYALIDLVQPVVELLMNSLGALFSFILDNSEIFKALAIGAGVAAVAFGGFQIASFLLGGGLMTLAGTAMTAASTITAAIFSIPIIGWIVAAIAAVVALGVYFYNTSEKFRSILFGVWGAVKTVFGGIGGFVMETLQAVWTMIKNVFNPANWFKKDYSFTADLAEIGNIARRYGESIGAGFEEGKQKGKDSFQASEDKKAEKEKSKRYGSAITAADLLSENDQTGGDGTATSQGAGGAAGGQKGLSLSGAGGGGGKSITMNLTMNNYFNSQTRDEGEVIARRINDRLSDALAAI